jgi:hypothetical protein
MGEVRGFVRARLRETLRDPDRHFPFAALLARFIRGQNLDEVPPDLRGNVQRESVDAFWDMRQDLKRIAAGLGDGQRAWREETRLSVIRALFLGTPAFAGVTPMRCVYHHFLRSYVGQP